MRDCLRCALLGAEEKLLKYDDGGFTLYWVKYCAGRKYHGYLIESIPDNAVCTDFITTTGLMKIKDNLKEW